VIIDALLGAIQSVTLWALGGLPVVSNSDAPFSGWGLIVDNLGAMNYFLPVAELFSFVIGVSVVFPALAGVSLLVWLVALIRGGSARA
jgi:hypothetical protein